MSEEKKVEYNNGSNEFVDYFLVDVIGTANENFNTDDQSLMPATISVNGTIYSGYIIGGAVWCDLSIKYTESTAVNSDIAQGMKKYFTGIKNTHYTPEALKESK
ncbi:hypothetical protein HBA43_21575, partial [Providencia rettgeri]|uniref:hypothetical protein n=1 Tax=Providencia rettgeri TaxID=587 RepID=UPI0014198E77